MRSRIFRNPLDIILAKEATTCKGCRFKTSLWGLAFCVIKNKAGAKLRRCKRYQEIER